MGHYKVPIDPSTPICMCLLNAIEQSYNLLLSSCNVSGDYMNPDNVYEDIADVGSLRKHMNDLLDDYNSTPGVVRMDLVLFRDAIEHGM